MAEPLAPDLPDSLDEVHRQVRDAFQRADLDAYLELLAPDLAYREANRRTHTREALAASLRDQFRRLLSFGSEFQRDSLVVENGDAVEIGTQTAWIALRWFVVFALRWNVRRRGRFVWRRIPGGWQLRAVELYEERVTLSGVGLAARHSATLPT